MDKEAFERHLAYAGEVRPSMKRRADAHDYHERRIYMITIAVEGRRPLLGRLAGDVTAALGTAEFPHVVLTALGEAVAAAWAAIPRYHPEVEVIALQVMPDHIHGILFVRERIAQGLGKVILGFKTGCNKVYRQMTAGDVGQVAAVQQRTRQAGQPWTATGRHTGHEAGLLFERGYNDRILLREGQLAVMKRYLEENPYRLAMKRARPELLRVREGVEIGRWRCSAVGNMALLRADRLLQVRVSRSIDGRLLESERERLLGEARAGAVLVSPSISPGEKAIMRAAFDEGLSVIALASNGLDAMQKPSGERFRACAEGRLLILSPFPHINNRTVITREACNTLNALAWEICRMGAGR